MWTGFPLSVADRVDLCFVHNTSKCWNMLKITRMRAMLAQNRFQNGANFEAICSFFKAFRANLSSFEMSAVDTRDGARAMLSQLSEMLRTVNGSPLSTLGTTLGTLGTAEQRVESYADTLRAMRDRGDTHMARLSYIRDSLEEAVADAKRASPKGGDAPLGDVPSAGAGAQRESWQQRESTRRVREKEARDGYEYRKRRVLGACVLTHAQRHHAQ